MSMRTLSNLVSLKMLEETDSGQTAGVVAGKSTQGMKVVMSLSQLIISRNLFYQPPPEPARGPK